MKQLVTAMALTLVLLLLVGQVQAGPLLTVPEKSFDFGYVPQNAKISHTFWLHSSGDDTLKIVSVKPG
ncbi:MAG TPA: hypothetical protein PLF13_06975 [candidate division Zixibacteria bacterium]|nr:hypothetical protein [candidate division Zixibacteria bacterium]